MGRVGKSEDATLGDLWDTFDTYWGEQQPNPDPPAGPAAGAGAGPAEPESEPSGSADADPMPGNPKEAEGDPNVPGASYYDMVSLGLSDEEGGEGEEPDVPVDKSSPTSPPACSMAPDNVNGSPASTHDVCPAVGADRKAELEAKIAQLQIRWEWD